MWHTLSDRLIGIHVAKQDEVDGLDLPEMAIKGYESMHPEPTTYAPAVERS
jgi:hypothetical protein